MINLEKHLIPFKEWKEKSPQHVYDMAMEEHEQGVPTGIGYIDDIGWYILQSSGQGPYLIYSER